MAKKAVKKSLKAKPRKAAKKVRRSPAANVVNPAFVQALAKLHVTLKSNAETPDQHADAAIVGLASKEAANGNSETVGSLLGRISNWVRDHQSEIQGHLAHAIMQAIRH